MTTAKYIFRINYAEYHAFIRNEAKNGILRQGWGKDGTDIKGGRDRFVSCWGQNPAYFGRKFHNISTMLDMKPGDIIVVPKLNLDNCGDDRRFFSVFECTGFYCFDLPETVNDFGHTIPVKKLGSFRYDGGKAENKLSDSFRYYRSPVNRVKKEEISELIDSVIY